MAERAVLFVDGNNWYHGMRRARVPSPSSLDYAKISRQLVQERIWRETRYYIGQIPQTGDQVRYAEQRRFLPSLQDDDHRITCHLGRLKSRRVSSPAALDLERFMDSLSLPIDERIRRDLVFMARRHRTAEVLVEKAVDVMLAVDLVVMAEGDQYDTAYLLSADGDFTPAVAAVRAAGKDVYAVSPTYGAQPASAATAFIHIDREWFRGCYRE